MKKVLLCLFLFPSLVFASFNQDIRYGSSGSMVRELQQFLLNDGCLTTNPTGFFWFKTREAVKCFQTKHQLPKTGFFGPLTRAVANGTLEQIALPLPPPVQPAQPVVLPTPQPVAGNSCTGKTKGDSCAFNTASARDICDNALNGDLLFCVPVR